MRKLDRLIPLLFIFLLASSAAYGRGVYMADWRWRSDDGNVDAATWMGEENEKGTLVGTEEIIRLRTRHRGETDLNDMLVFEGVSTTGISYATYFSFADSPYLDPEDAVGRKLSVDIDVEKNPVPYDEGGRIVEAPCVVPAAPEGTSQEIELCLKAKNDTEVPENTYTFEFEATSAVLDYLNPRPPVISTGNLTGIVATSAVGTGEITDTGLRPPREHGLCWSTSPSPGITDDHTDNGRAADPGTFTCSITGLAPSTTYYLRAYATNTCGTVYGEEVSFTTKAAAITPMDDDSYGAGECFIKTATTGRQSFITKFITSLELQEKP